MQILNISINGACCGSNYNYYFSSRVFWFKTISKLSTAKNRSHGKAVFCGILLTKAKENRYSHCAFAI
jgi:hypothetical protein